MRIVHLSDIHLSEDNYSEFINNYRSALINDLSTYNSPIPIDLIVITGDLVDKGGHSLFNIKGFELYKNPYDIFKKEFIDPISQQLGIPLHRFLFVPGNHDVDEREILLYEENILSKGINFHNVNSYLNNNHSFTHNKRIKKFKDFEKEYHKDNSNYIYSANQSTFIYQKDDLKIGFILVNDSWRCKSIRLTNDPEKLFFGEQQLYDAVGYLDQIETDLNICLLHHSIDDFAESSSIEGILNRKNIELFLYGHFHSVKTENLYTAHGTCLGFRSRAALFKPEEQNSDYHSGYQILDFDLKTYKLSQIHYRKYNYKDSAKIFIADNETAPINGIDKNQSNGNNGFNLNRINRKTQPVNLPKDLFKS